jgi:hypothetical protein
LHVNPCTKLKQGKLFYKSTNQKKIFSVVSHMARNYIAKNYKLQAVPKTDEITVNIILILQQQFLYNDY